VVVATATNVMTAVAFGAIETGILIAALVFKELSASYESPK